MRLKLLYLFMLCGLLLAGCAEKKHPISGPPGWCERDVISIDFNEHSLVNYRLAKQYMHEGRYELAQYRLELAHHSAQNANERWMIQRELDKAKRHIQTIR